MRRTPDTVAPSLEGADERAALRAWIRWQRGGWAVLTYPRFRRAREAAALRALGRPRQGRPAP